MHMQTDTHEHPGTHRDTHALRHARTHTCECAHTGTHTQISEKYFRRIKIYSRYADVFISNFSLLYQRGKTSLDCCTKEVTANILQYFSKFELTSHLEMEAQIRMYG